MRVNRSTLGVAVAAFVSLGLLLLATKNLGEILSPQGCRMSWMSPSYVLQSKFDAAWTPLARRYSLWLYREVGWDSSSIGGGLPVLFIPGNAGSSHQRRGSTTSNPHQIAPEFSARTGSHKPLDFFAVEFNEDLSAFHGTTLESQIDYTSKAVEYILSLYPSNTRVIVLAHSMGGVVAASLLPSSNISAIITMSTPYTLPPARFDNVIDAIYSKNAGVLKNDPTPISCILPQNSQGGYRRTRGPGVGHVEMVWCHQVRWRVARAALELGPYSTEKDRVGVLDKWLRDGHTLPASVIEPKPLAKDAAGTVIQLPQDKKMLVTIPRHDVTHLLPIPEERIPEGRKSGSARFTLMLSRGTIDAVGPQNPLPLRAFVYQCKGHDIAQSACLPVRPDVLKLIPTPVPNHLFPVPQSGSDESEGVVLFEAFLESLDPATTHIAVKLENGDGRGWAIANFGEEKDEALHAVSTISLVFGGAIVPIPSLRSLHNVIHFPNLLSHVLLVYRAKAIGNQIPQCKDSVFPPLLAHTSNPDETHYFPLTDHNDRPFIDTARNPVHKGVSLDLYSSGISECTESAQSIEISIDWPATLGRWATRYWTSTLVWTVGVVSLVIFYSWKPDGQIPPVSVSLNRYSNLLIRRLLPASFIFSVVPLPKSYYLGNAGEPVFAVVAPLILTISSGLVIGTWWFLCVLLAIVGKSTRIFSRRSVERRNETSSVSRNTVISIVLVFLVIFLFVPWQVAFLGCWVLQLYNCASAVPERSEDSSAVDGRLTRTSLDEKYEAEVANTKANNANFNSHLLLLMTWLLPLVAPILAVWVRTLATAGLTTPFNGDHNFLMARFEGVVSARWLFAMAAVVAFVAGSIKPYIVFHAVAIALAIIVSSQNWAAAANA
ncbi:PGAP1-like protein-domain-containing protein [Ephemerocybe angulata]|uniref:GPI inositol-deacylase n=1 Tax=Ephemerocybe angulata TaxID=980116 RepID=A0A8H6IAQ7_9AGAR|nr:PGAP1-like protein-domain-containing protein [Tulosesus angulatus]